MPRLKKYTDQELMNAIYQLVGKGGNRFVTRKFIAKELNLSKSVRLINMINYLVQEEWLIQHEQNFSGKLNIYTYSINAAKKPTSYEET